MKKFIAVLMMLLALITTFISTAVTIIPISIEFNGTAQYIIILMFGVLQITMFLIAIVKFVVKKETPQHYVFIIRIQRLLLAISILGTMSFFNMSRAHITENEATIKQLFNIVPFIDQAPFYKWLVENVVYFGYIGLICVLLDVVSLRLPTISHDLYFGLKDEAKINTFWSKLWHLATHKIVNRVNQAYDKSIIQYLPPESVPDLEPQGAIDDIVIEQMEEIGEEGPPELIVLITDYIKNGPAIVESGKIKEAFSLSKPEWSALAKQLIAAGVIKKHGTSYIKEAL